MESLTAIWFVINLAFVAAAIAFLFVSRAVQEAARRGDAPSASRLRRVRTLVGIMAVVLFVAMAAVFLTNMRVNG